MSPSVIHIPQPCAENWAAMTPTATGRHCAACAKNVVDFTQLSDAEILEHLARAGRGGTCGRFRVEQLARPLQPLALAPPTRWRTWLATLAAVWGLREVGSSAAQAQDPAEQHVTTGAPMLLDKLQIRHTDDYEGIRPAIGALLRGTVVDSATHEGLPGVSVILHGTTHGTATAADGTFALQLTAEELTAGSDVRLDFKYLGYKTQSAAVAEIMAANGSFLSSMPIDTLALQGIVVGGIHAGPVAKPWPWHPRRFYYWSKYWLTRPFRR